MSLNVPMAIAGNKLCDTKHQRIMGLHYVDQNIFMHVTLYYTTVLLNAVSCMQNLHVRTDSATGSLSSETSVWVSWIYIQAHTQTGIPVI